MCVSCVCQCVRVRWCVVCVCACVVGGVRTASKAALVAWLESRGATSRCAHRDEAARAEDDDANSLCCTAALDTEPEVVLFHTIKQINQLKKKKIKSSIDESHLRFKFPFR